MPTYANGYKQTVLKTGEPKGLWVRIPTLALWYRGVMVSHLIANQAYRNVVRVRITAIPFATTQMAGTSAAR